MVIDHKPETAEKKGAQIGEQLGAEKKGASEAFQKELSSIGHGSASEQNAFYSKLRDTAHGHLPGIDIQGDAEHHNLKVTEKGKDGKEKTLYDQAGKEKEEHTVKAGEGPYQILQRQHPEWNHEQLRDEARKIKKETGRENFAQGEHLKINADGSVVSRKENGENYSEVTSAGGKVKTTSTHTVDGKGGFTDSTENKETGAKSVHVQDEKGNYSRKEFDGQGKLTGEQSREKTPEGADSITTRKPDGSFTKSTINPDKSRVEHVQAGNGDYSQKKFAPDGSFKSEQIRQTAPDGSASMTERNSDNSFKKVTLNADKSRVEHNQDAAGNYTEKTLDQNNQVTRERSLQKNADQSETLTDRVAGQGFVRRTTNADHSRSIHEEDKDGNYTEKRLDPEGKPTSIQTHKILEGGIQEDIITDGQGRVVRKWQRNPDGSPR